MGQAFQQLGAIAQGAFARIIEQSPSMGSAFAQMTFASNEMWMAIGEALAPIIEETLLPLILTLTDFITNLDPAFRQWIGLVIALTVAASALAAALFAVQVISGTIIIPILVIIGLIAGAIVLFRNWERISVKVKLILFAIAVVIGFVLAPIGFLVAGIIGIIAVIKNWGAILDWLKGVWITFIGIVGKAGKIVTAVTDSIWGAISGALNAVINFFNNMIIDPINVIINFVDDKIWKPKKDNFGTLPRIPTFADGGFMPFTGFAYLHQGERVLNPSETQAFTTLQKMGIPINGGGGGPGGQNITITNEITIDGGIFLDRSSIDTLTDMLSERLLEKVLRSINGV